MKKSFVKMQGLGNDFVVFDAREKPVQLSKANIQKICNRRLGVGCDQLIVIEPADDADAFMRIYNADGSEAEMCGNAARCVVDFILRDQEARKLIIKTVGGKISSEKIADNLINVNIGPAYSEWQKVPLASEQSTLHVEGDFEGLLDPVAVNVGNPHLVFFVKDVDAVDLEKIGPKIENNLLFPERINVEVVQILDRKTLRMRVWERGTGLTQACGSGACAVAVAAARRNLADRDVKVKMDGGDLDIYWHNNNTVWMTGPAETAFMGIIDLSDD